MSISFGHICPIPHLEDFVKGRKFHLVLAHLIEQSEDYTSFYRQESENGATIIMDNSAYEMFYQGKEMFPADKLLELATKVKADYIVLPDYPNEPMIKTIHAAKEYAPIFKEAGFKTFFVPQSQSGMIYDLCSSLFLAFNNNKDPSGTPFADYVGLSCIGVPNGYGVLNQRIGRYLARSRFLEWELVSVIIKTMRDSGIKIHFLGMSDGPREISLVRRFAHLIDSWDSSTAIWHGLNGIHYDSSPTGLINGKISEPVDFFKKFDSNVFGIVKRNMEYIDRKCVEVVI